MCHESLVVLLLVSLIMSYSTGEYVQGDSVGEYEVLTGSGYSSTVHAVRDTELAKIPKHLFESLSMRYPQVTVQILRLIALRSSSGADADRTAPRAMQNIKTVAVVPSTANVSIDAFCSELAAGVSRVNSCRRLTSGAILERLGKQAFHRVGKLKLVSWLEEQEEMYGTVLYQVDQLSSPWMKRCIRRADLILIVANASADGALGEYEQELVANLKTTARKDLVLVHEGYVFLLFLDGFWSF